MQHIAALFFIIMLTLNIQAGIGAGSSAEGPLPVEEVVGAVPTEYLLEHNYPNPFNPSTVIAYSIPKASHVSIKVFDLLGNLITTLVNQYQEAGKFKVKFNADELSNGVYFYKIQSGSFTDIKKMLLLK